MLKTDILILGGGITGLSAAYHLKNKNYILLEKEDKVGGLCRSVTDEKGFTYDYTGHLLHLKDNYVKKLVAKLLKGNLVTRNRNSWIYSNKVFTRYPFQANLYGLPQNVVQECIQGLVEAKLHSSSSTIHNSSFIIHNSFYDFCLKTFGSGISKYFMIPYNEKLWRTSTKELTTEWMGNFVPQPTLHEVVYGAYHDNKEKFGYNATFLYPKHGGIQALIDKLKDNLPKIKRNIEIYSIDTQKKFVKTCIGDIHYKNLISTIPLPELVKLIKGAPANVKNASRKLKCTSVLNINIGIKRSKVSDKHWVYFPEKQFAFYRAGFYNNFSEQLCPKGTSSMYIEISYRGSKISKQKMLAKALSNLKSAGIIKPSDKIVSKVFLDIPYAYVVYDKNRKSAVDAIKKYLNKKSVHSIGRYGGWEYSTMEDAILQGRAIANKL